MTFIQLKIFLPPKTNDPDVVSELNMWGIKLEIEPFGDYINNTIDSLAQSVQQADQLLDNMHNLWVLGSSIEGKIHQMSKSKTFLTSFLNASEEIMTRLIYNMAYEKTEQYKTSLDLSEIEGVLARASALNPAVDYLEFTARVNEQLKSDTFFYKHDTEHTFQTLNFVINSYEALLRNAIEIFPGNNKITKKYLRYVLLVYMGC